MSYCNMGEFTSYILLIVFPIVFVVGNQRSEDCFYNPGLAGKKCFDEHYQTYTCCPANSCQNGVCTASGGAGPSKDLPLHTYIVIGVGMTTFALVCIVLGVFYWHRKQMGKPERPTSIFASFAQPSSVSLQTTNSPPTARARTPISQQSSIETKANADIHTATTV